MRYFIFPVVFGVTALFAAQSADRYFAVPLPPVPDKIAPAVQLTGTETPKQLADAYTAAINSLVPGLANADQQALDVLEATVHHAGRPGAEAERLACCNAIVAILTTADTAPRVKSHLLRQLQVIGKAESIPTLLKLLRDPDPHVASDARMALDSNPACPPEHRSASKPTEPATPARLRQDRFTALRASLLAAGDNAVPQMIQLLAGNDADGRAVALGMIYDLSAAGRQKLIANADKLPATIKAIVIESLADLDEKSVLPLARASLKSDDSLLRSAGLTAISRLDDPEADNALIAAMNEATGEMKAHLITAIGQRGKRTAVPALLAVTSDSDANVARAAYRALGELADATDLPALLAKLPDSEVAVSRTLGRITPPERGAEILQTAFAGATDKNVRAALLKMFRYCPGPKALTALQSALQDKEAAVRETAVRTLADWPDATVLDTLAAIYQNPEKPAFAVVALRGIVRLSQAANKQPTPALVARYRQLLAIARNEDDRRRVLGALGGCGHVEALELALSQLEVPGVRAEAEAAVKNLAALLKKKHPKEAKAALQRLKK